MQLKQTPKHILLFIIQVKASLQAVEEERDVLQNKFQIETDSRKEMEGKHDLQLDIFKAVLINTSIQF